MKIIHHLVPADSDISHVIVKFLSFVAVGPYFLLQTELIYLNIDALMQQL